MGALLITARFFHFTAVIILTGVFAFERLVCGPAFRQSGATVASAAGLHRRLGRLAWASLALATGSGAAWLVAVAAGMSGKPIGVALLQGAVPVVLTHTRFGEDWLLRFALAVLLGFWFVFWLRAMLAHAPWREPRAERCSRIGLGSAPRRCCMAASA